MSQDGDYLPDEMDPNDYEDEDDDDILFVSTSKSMKLFDSSAGNGQTNPATANAHQVPNCYVEEDDYSTTESSNQVEADYSPDVFSMMGPNRMDAALQSANAFRLKRNKLARQAVAPYGKRIRSDSKPNFYPCKHCDKRFAYRHVRDRHEGLHNDFKPYRCKVCGQCSNDRQVVINHIRRKHLRVPRLKRDQLRQNIVEEDPKQFLEVRKPPVQETEADDDENGEEETVE